MPIMHKLKSLQHFPAQGGYLGARVQVCFNYDTSALYGGVVVRDDAVEPGLMIVRLDSGEHVTSVECQWSPTKIGDATSLDLGDGPAGVHTPEDGMRVVKR